MPLPTFIGSPNWASRTARLSSPRFERSFRISPRTMFLSVCSDHPFSTSPSKGARRKSWIPIYRRNLLINSIKFHPTAPRQWIRLRMCNCLRLRPLPATTTSIQRSLLCPGITARRLQYAGLIGRTCSRGNSFQKRRTPNYPQCACYSSFCYFRCHPFCSQTEYMKELCFACHPHTVVTSRWMNIVDILGKFTA